MSLTRGWKPDAPMGRGEGIAGRVAHLDAGSSDGEERETGDSGAGDAAESGSGGDARPGGGLLVGRCEGIDRTFGEVRFGSRGASRGCAGRWAWKTRAQTRGDGRDARHQSRAPREPGGGQGRFPRRRLRTSGTRCHRATWRRALERGGKDAYLRRGAACARCVNTPLLAVDFGRRGATACGARDRAASPQLQHLKGCFISSFLRGGWASRRASAQHVKFSPIFQS